MDGQFENIPHLKIRLTGLTPSLGDAGRTQKDVIPRARKVGEADEHAQCSKDHEVVAL